jgi:hypothetical protein
LLGDSVQGHPRRRFLQLPPQLLAHRHLPLPISDMSISAVAALPKPRRPCQVAAGLTGEVRPASTAAPRGLSNRQLALREIPEVGERAYIM